MCGKLVAVSISCSPELLSFFAMRATSTPLLTMNSSSPLTHKNRKIAIVYAVSFSLNTLFDMHTRIIYTILVLVIYNVIIICRSCTHLQLQLMHAWSRTGMTLGQCDII